MSRDADIVCGINAVLAAIENAPEALLEVLYTRERRDRRLGALLEAARGAGVACHAAPARQLDEIADGVRHQGVVARRRAASARAEGELEAVLAAAAQPLLLVLDGVQDPQNLGACLRSAAAAGADAVILPRDHSAPLTAATRRAAAGAAEMVPVFYVANLSRTLKKLKELGVWLVAITHDAAKDIYAVDMKGPTALVLGAEGEGLRRLTRDHCDFEAAIPMSGRMESLNVSVAAGVALFEAVRQRCGNKGILK